MNDTYKRIDPDLTRMFNLKRLQLGNDVAHPARRHGTIDHSNIREELSACSIFPDGVYTP